MPICRRSDDPQAVQLLLGRAYAARIRRRRPRASDRWHQDEVFVRIGGALPIEQIEQNDEWAVQRCRYMMLATMKVSEDTMPMLAAVAS